MAWAAWSSVKTKRMFGRRAGSAAGAGSASARTINVARSGRHMGEGPPDREGALRLLPTPPGPRQHFSLRPGGRAVDLEAKPVQLDLLGALVGVGRAAALYAQAQVPPQGDALADVVVAVAVSVGLQDPAPGAPL